MCEIECPYCETDDEWHNDGLYEPDEEECFDVE